MGWNDDGDDGEDIGEMKHEHSTAKATLFVGPSGHKLWVPLSVILEGPDLGETDMVTVKRWWAEQNGY